MAGDVAEKVGEDCNVEDGRMGGGGDSGPDGEGDIDLLENGERRDEAVSSSHQFQLTLAARSSSLSLAGGGVIDGGVGNISGVGEEGWRSVVSLKEAVAVLVCS
jgi:hypothetical protein